MNEHTKEEKPLPYSRISTNKCRKNNRLRKSVFGNHHSNNKFN